MNTTYNTKQREDGKWFLLINFKDIYLTILLKHHLHTLPALILLLLLDSALLSFRLSLSPHSLSLAVLTCALIKCFGMVHRCFVFLCSIILFLSVVISDKSLIWTTYWAPSLAEYTWRAVPGTDCIMSCCLSKSAPNYRQIASANWTKSVPQICPTL